MAAGVLPNKGVVGIWHTASQAGRSWTGLGSKLFLPSKHIISGLQGVFSYA